MLITFQVLMIVVVLFTLMGVIGENNDIRLVQILCGVCVVSIVLLFVSVIL